MPVLPSSESTESVDVNRPIEPPPLNCRLRLLIEDLRHPAVQTFLKAIDGSKDLEEQAKNVVRLLYNHESHRPGTRSVTFILHDFDGIAYTTGIDLDDDHKEIHFSLNYIKHIGGEPRHEILGVLCHELVHCFQWNANGTCPSGLIEGMADWVRLNAGLAAEHWQRGGEKWDEGYQNTGFFLDWLDKKFGAGTTGSINAKLRKGPYDEADLFKSCCHGHKVEDLWKEYREDIERGTSSTSPLTLPTHAPRAR